MKANEQAEAARKAKLQARKAEKARTAMLRRVGTAGLAVMLVTAVALLLWALSQRSASIRETVLARKAQREAKLEADNAVSAQLNALAQEGKTRQALAESQIHEEDAIKASKAAKTSETKAQKEKRKAEDLVDRMATTAPEDFETAEANYQSALEFVDKCEERAALINSRKEFQALDHRYGLLPKYGSRARQRLDGIERKLTMIGLKTEAFVGFNGIQSGILKFVSLQLGHQSDATALLLLVNQHPGSSRTDHGQRHFELLAAIAA